MWPPCWPPAHWFPVAGVAPSENRRTLLRGLGWGLVLSVGLGAVLIAPNLPVQWALVALVVGLPFAYLGVRRVLPAGTLTARRGLPANVVFAAAMSMAFFTADLFIPLALTSVRGISATLAVILTTVTVPVPVGTGLAGALVATMGATAAGLSGVLVVAGAGVVLALLASTRFAETHPPLTPPER